MKISKQNIGYYFKCIKSKTNDPIDWINKDILSEEKFNLLNKVFDDLLLLKKESKKMNDSEEIRNVKFYFENEQAFKYFNTELDKLIERKLLFKKSFIERLFLFINSINFYVIILILILLAIIFLVNILNIL